MLAAADAQPQKPGRAALTALWLVYFGCFLLAWKLFPGRLYGGIDGSLSLWLTRAQLDWSAPFQVAPWNPYAGAGSTFFPLDPWLNPGLAVLALLRSPASAKLLSYAVFWLELVVSTYAMARMLSASRLVAHAAALLAPLVAFPPFDLALQMSGTQMSAPYYLHGLALGNLALGALHRAGLHGTLGNITAAAAFAALLLAQFFALPMVIPAWAPTYTLLYLALALWPCAPPGGSTRLWRLGALAGAALAFATLSVPEFWLHTIETTARAHNHLVLRPLDGFLEGLRTFDTCFPSFPPPPLVCGDTPYRSAFLVAAALGALACLLSRRNALRPLAVGFAAYSVMVYGFGFIAHLRFFDEVVPAHMDFLFWPTVSVQALFGVLAVARLGGALPVALAPAAARLGLLVLPLAAAAILVQSSGGPEQLARHLREKTKPPDGSPPPRAADTPLLAELRKEAAQRPGEAFRGRVVSWLGSLDGPMRPHLGVRGLPYSLALQHYDAQGYVVARYGSPHSLMDLWGRQLATLEEYGQAISVPLLAVYRHLLADPQDRFMPNLATVFRADLRVLRAFGVRFVITDRELAPHDARLRVRLDAPGALPLNLYELNEVNLAGYSPTRALATRAAVEAMRAMKDPQFDPQRDVVVLGDTPGTDLVRATDAALVFGPNEVRVRASSPGRSLLLLPVQYSRCWSVHGSGARLLRADLALAALEFEKSADVQLRYAPSLGEQARCRAAEAADLQMLDFRALAGPVYRLREQRDSAAQTLK